MGCSVGLYDPAGNALRCPCHGSQFHVDGTVLSGPAPKALYRYNTHFDGVNALTIDLYKAGFAMKFALLPVVPGKARRCKLSFPTEPGIFYHVQFKSGVLDAAWTDVSFALTPDGPADQQQIDGDGDAHDAFVDLPNDSGYFVIYTWKRLIG
jgi:hypothetical protein